MISRSQQKRIAVLQGKQMPMFCLHCEAAAKNPALHQDRWFSADSERWVHVVNSEKIMCGDQ